jgi:hypothetical protein
VAGQEYHYRFHAVNARKTPCFAFWLSVLSLSFPHKKASWRTRPSSAWKQKVIRLLYTTRRYLASFLCQRAKTQTGCYIYQPVKTHSYEWVFTE